MILDYPVNIFKREMNQINIKQGKKEIHGIPNYNYKEGDIDD